MAGDIVATVKYVRDKASEYGIDPTKICLYGVSGGGYAVAAACSLMAQKKQASMVRFAIMNMAIAPSYWFTDDKEKMPHKQAREASYDGPFVAK